MSSKPPGSDFSLPSLRDLLGATWELNSSVPNLRGRKRPRSLRSQPSPRMLFLGEVREDFLSQLRGSPWREGLNALWMHLALCSYLLLSLWTPMLACILYPSAASSQPPAPTFPSEQMWAPSLPWGL